MEYTEYFSATLSSGTDGSAMIPGTNDVPGCMDETALNMIQLLLYLMVPVTILEKFVNHLLISLQLVVHLMVLPQQPEPLKQVKSFILPSQWIKHGKT